MPAQEKTPCERCGTMILPATAKRTGGICMTCLRLSQGAAGLMKDGKTINKELNEEEKEGCFIATAVMGDANDDSVILLRRFRDEFLGRGELGRKFIQSYYKYSPPMAVIIGKSVSLRFICRLVLILPLTWLAQLILGISMRR